MATALETSLRRLTDIQREAANWDRGPLLVLAGPGSGKTRVLTCRVARLLEESPDQRFRILALTFTNKAAHEMSSRVTTLVPGLEERAHIDTFHGFCAQVLRQHGVHLGIRPNFTIYSRMSDRRAVLDDVIANNSQELRDEDRQLLPLIDALKAQLVGPDEAERRVAVRKGMTEEKARHVALVYALYEESLHLANALDFNSLILKAYELFAHPAITRHYQAVYRYWLIDEFQDTNGAQYALLRRMSAGSFGDLFAVADDDQTIYEWNGANVARIRQFATDYSCRMIQLPTNFRCPPQVVEAANRLVVYNARRVASKVPAEPGQPGSDSPVRPMEYRVFSTDEDEVAGIAADIANLGIAERDATAVLARNRALLESMDRSLRDEGVASAILMRRDDFLSPQMRWLVACLKQIDRPLDRHNMATLVDAYGGFCPLPTDFDEIVSRLEADGIAYLKIWLNALQEAGVPPDVSEAVNAVSDLAAGVTKLNPSIERVVGHFGSNDPHDDLVEDLSAWRRLVREIKKTRGSIPLDQFLQELELRSKEPSLARGTVSLATIHGAKGLEFETVYLIGMAEEILPSWHSVKTGAGDRSLEEERRGCFVAITRTNRRLILSRARSYKGWPKKPSRFLKEMGLLEQTASRNDGRKR